MNTHQEQEEIRPASLFRRGGSAFLVHVFGAGMGFGLQVFLARVLSPDEFGTYVYVLSWVLLLTLCCKLGMDSLLVRYIPKYQAEKRDGALNGVQLFADKVVLIASLVLMVVAGLVILPNLFGLEVRLMGTFQIGIVLVPLLALVGIRQSILMAFQRTSLSLVPEKIVWPVLTAVLVVCSISILGYTPTSANCMALAVLAALVSLCFGSVVVRRHRASIVQKGQTDVLSREWISAAFPLLVISLSQLVLAKADILLLGIFQGASEEVAQYAVASTVASLVGFFIASANMVIAPMISRLYSLSQHEELQRLVVVSSRFLLLVSTPVFLVLMLFSDSLLNVFGEGYRNQEHVIGILLLGQLFIVCGGSVGFLMTMTGNHRIAAAVIVTAAVFDMVLALSLLPMWGAVGAAIATTCSIAFRTIALALLVWRRLRIMPTVLAPFLIGLVRPGGRDSGW